MDETQKAVLKRRPKKVGVVFDYGEIKIFPSINQAAKYLDVSHVALLKALRAGRPCFGMECFYVNN